MSLRSERCKKSGMIKSTGAGGGQAEPQVKGSPSTISTRSAKSKKRKGKKEQQEGEPFPEGDMHFFKSIMPFVRSLHPYKKLQFRSDINNLLLREVNRLQEPHGPQQPPAHHGPPNHY
jgi:hypothetical protein